MSQTGFRDRFDEARSTAFCLSAGEPIEEHGDLFGSSVQLAARLCARADPGSIVVSEDVFRRYGQGPVSFESLGEVVPKGFEQPVRIFGASD